MSDVQQGPDWWLASDGKWYPPTSTPAAPAPPPGYASPGAPPPGFASPAGPPPGPPPGAPPGFGAPPPFAAQGAPAYPSAPGWAPAGPGGPLRVSPGLSGTLQGFFWATGAMALVAALLTFAARSSFAGLENGGFEDLVDWADQHDGATALAGFTYVLWVVVFILLIIWTYKAHTVTQQLWSGERTWARGWSVGAWFIPIANVVLPKLVLTEIEKIAAAPRQGGRTSPEWRSQSTSGIGWVWWILLVIGLAGAGVGTGLLGPDDELLFKSEDEILRGYLVMGLGLLVWAVSCVFGALFIRRMGKEFARPA